MTVASNVLWGVISNIFSPCMAFMQNTLHFCSRVLQNQEIDF